MFYKIKNTFEKSEIYLSKNLLWSKAIISTIIGSIGFGITYSCFVSIDEVVIARGELQAIGAERPIKSLIEGKVSKIYISEGELVKQGDPLITIDTKNIEIKKEGLIAELESLGITLQTKKDIVYRLLDVVDEGGISKIEYLKQKDELQKIKSQISKVSSRLKELKLLEINSKLISPLRGRVFNLIPASPGYVITKGETLLKIVPEGELEAKVFFNNVDVGFVKPQMKAKIRIDSYPFTQFGSIPGTLKAIGDEVLPKNSENRQSQFPAYLKLERQFLKKNDEIFSLRSGQSVSANLIVREKPLISLLSDSIEKTFDSLRNIRSE